jgi:hypothetical protein
MKASETSDCELYSLSRVRVGSLPIYARQPLCLWWQQRQHRRKRDSSFWTAMDAGANSKPYDNASYVIVVSYIYYAIPIDQTSKYKKKTGCYLHGPDRSGERSY